MQFYNRLVALGVICGVLQETFHQLHTWGRGAGVNPLIHFPWGGGGANGIYAIAYVINGRTLTKSYIGYIGVTCIVV